MKQIIVCCLLLISVTGQSQELYVFSEPASNMPAKSMGARVSTMFGRGYHGENMYRLQPEVQFGFNKNFMMHIGTTVSNMYTPSSRWESVYLYGKYRFLSIDDMHKHFRMAAFGEVSHSRNEYHFEEVNITGDRSGFQVGLIATQLVNKLAVSATVSHTQAMDPTRYDRVQYTPKPTYSSFNYSLSAGYLILPFEYRSYDQLNMNIYLELLGQQTLDRKTYYVDLAPALQFIIGSNTKLNLGYRRQLRSNQFRSMQKSFLIAVEHTFFNALKKKN